MTNSRGSTVVSSADQITIDFNSTFMQPDTYQATLCIQNNDPTYPQMRIPLTLTVLAVPTALEIAQLSADNRPFWPWTWLVSGIVLLLMACAGWCVLHWRRKLVR